MGKYFQKREYKVVDNRTRRAYAEKQFRKNFLRQRMGLSPMA
jgi:hypothetical protein